MTPRKVKCLETSNKHLYFTFSMHTEADLHSEIPNNVIILLYSQLQAG